MGRNLFFTKVVEGQCFYSSMLSSFRVILIASIFVTANVRFYQFFMTTRTHSEDCPELALTVEKETRRSSPEQLESLAQTPVAFYRVLGNAVNDGRLSMEQANQLILATQVRFSFNISAWRHISQPPLLRLSPSY